MNPATSKLLLYPLLFCLLSASTASAGLFRWVDENGKIHYSDSVPPQMSQGGHTELDKNGNRINKVEAAKSAEEVEEERWLSGLEDKLKDKQQQQRRKDEVLLSSYHNIDEFDAYYVGQFDALQEEREQLEQLSQKLADELKKLRTQHSEAESSGAKKRIQGFIDSNEENSAAYELALKQNADEVSKLRQEAQALRKRYLYLVSKLEQSSDKTTRE